MRIVVPYSKEVLDATIYEYQEAFWPFQFIFILLVLWILYSIWNSKEKHHRIISGIVAFFWFWTGLVFEANYYNNINWAGFYICLVFILQGFLLLWFGVFKNGIVFKQSHIFASLALLIIIAYLILQLLFGATVFEVSIIGMLPDTTALFSLLFLLIPVKKRVWSLLPIPVIWLVFSLYWNYLLLST